MGNAICTNVEGRESITLVHNIMVVAQSCKKYCTFYCSNLKAKSGKQGAVGHKLGLSTLLSLGVVGEPCVLGHTPLYCPLLEYYYFRRDVLQVGYTLSSCVHLLLRSVLICER